jgi:hypothetical protein
MRIPSFGILFLLGACNAGAVGNEGSRPMSQRSFEVGEFDSVALEGSYQVVVHVGDGPSVRAEGDALALERLDVRVEDGTLRIAPRRNMLDFRSFGRGATVYVTAPALDGARLAGSGTMRVDRIQSQAFEAQVSGSGGLRIEEVRAGRAEFSVSGSGSVRIDALEAEQFEAALSGSGSLRAAGRADNSRVAISGSGGASLAGLRTRRTSVAASGSGSVAVQASETVDGSLVGSGSVTVHGPARCLVARTGSGHIRCGA